MTAVWNVNDKKDKSGKGKSGKKSQGGAIAGSGGYLGDYDDNYDYGRWAGYTSSNSGSTGYWKDGKWHSNSPSANSDWWLNYKNCHTGNTVIMTIGDGTLYAGGWTRGAKAEAGWFVLDLADHFASVSATADGFSRTLHAANSKYTNQIVSMYIKDFGVPEWKQDFWLALAADVKDMLLSGKSILVACDGGHGRTGMVLSILAHLLGQTQGDDPIAYIRSIYCYDAVETVAQEKYVYEMCNLAAPVHTKNSEVAKHCIICGEIELDHRFGDDMDAEVCSNCISQYGLTDADLDKIELDLKGVKKDLEDAGAVIDGEVKEVPGAEFLGICVNCGNNLAPEDNLRDELCVLCNAQFGPNSNTPWVS